MNVHQVLQQYMANMDSRIEEIRSLIHNSVGASSGTSYRPRPTSHPPDPATSGTDLPPMLRSMKLQVPKFDRSDPSSWIF